MEIKKSREADLDRGRGQRFLLGLVLALACMYVGLEYTLTPDDPLDDPDLLEQLSIESELPPMMRQENELALAPKAEPKPTMKLKVVEEEVTEELQQEDEQVESDMDDDMNAQDEETTELEPALPDDEDAVSFRVVQDLPQFPGGPTEMMKWLTRNLKYPKSVEQIKQQGTVVAEFIINKDGSVTDVKIVSSFHPLCGREVLRVLRLMPRWTAGVMDGKPCRTKVSIPVVFRL